MAHQHYRTVGALLTVAFLGLILGGCGGTNSASTNPSAPTIMAQPSNETVTAGQTATFTVSASGSAPLSYQWQKGGTNIDGGTSAS